MPDVAVEEIAAVVVEETTIIAMDCQDFTDALAGNPKPTLFLQPTLGPKNCSIDLGREQLVVRPAKDWELEPRQPFRVEIWRSGSSWTRATATLLSVDSEGPNHNRAVLPLREVLDAFRNSCDFIRVYKR